MPKVRKEYENQNGTLTLKGSMPVFDSNNDINLLNNLNIPGAIVKSDNNNLYTQNLQNLSGTIALKENIKYYDLSGGRVTYTGTIPGITELYDGLAINVYFPVQTNTNCTVNINNLGAKEIYLTNDGTRVTTNIPAKAYVTLVYNATNDYFVWQRAYVDGNNYASVRQYQSGTGARVVPEYPILTRYNVTDKAGSYESAYTRYNPNVYINTDTGALGAVTFIENGTPLSQLYAPIGGGGGNAEWGSISGTLSNQTDLMSKFSEYATVSALSSYATQSYVNSSISALNYVSVGAASTAHTHTYSDVGALSAATHIPSDPVNADWSATTGLSSIKNKPTLGTAASMASTAFRSASWMPTYTDVGALSSSTFIPSVYGDVGAASAAHNHDGRYLSNSTDITTALGYTPISSAGSQVNADWSATSGVASILNKPILGTAASMASTAFRASTWTPTYADVGALSSSTFIPSVYGDVGAASAAHSHTYSDVGALSAGTHIPSDPVNADWNATTGLSSILNKPTLGTAASMASTAFRPASWMPTYSDVGALSSATVIPSTYSDVGAASASHTHTNYVERDGDTMTGQLVAQNNIAYTTAQVRNIILSTSEPTSTDGGNGDIWIVYKE